jgi:hypothetical protein
MGMKLGHSLQKRIQARGLESLFGLPPPPKAKEETIDLLPLAED